MEQASEILSQICGYMDAEQYRYHVREDPPMIQTGFGTRTGAYQVSIVTYSDRPVLGLYVPLPLVVPEDRRTAVAETITRANFGMCLGAFEMDMSDGRLMFKSAMPIGDATISHQQFRDLLGSAMAMVDLYFRSFVRLLYGDDLSPAEVIAEVEMARRPAAQ
jgi:hypothetical protein